MAATFGKGGLVSKSSLFKKGKDEEEEEKKKKVEQIPAPAPAYQPPKTSITTLPDKRVEYAIGEQRFNLSPEEYAATMGKGRGMITPQVKALQSLEQKQRLTKQIDEQLKLGASISQITEELIRQDVERKGRIAPAEAPKEISAEAPKEIPTAMGGPIYQKIKAKTGFIAPQEAGGLATAGFENMAVIGKPILKPFAAIYDLISSAFYGGKGIMQREAEQTLSQVEGDMLRDISLVELGLKPALEVKNIIVEAENVIIRLESTIHGINRMNLRYFLTDGKDVETRLKLARDNIADYYILLVQAQGKAILKEQQEAQIAARATYGQ